MEFGWTKEQEELYNKILLFSSKELNHSLFEREQSHQFPLNEWLKCGEFGLTGLSIPEQYGGIGLNTLTTAYSMEAFGRGCLDTGLVFSVAAHLFACLMPILEYANSEVKEQILPNLACGKLIGANAITEAEAGSDVFALKTTIKKQNDHYLVSGVKTYVTNGPIANIFVVYGTTNPSYGHMGITGLIIERDRPGITIGKPFSKMGLTTSPICPIYFDDCLVPINNRLGEEGEGATIFKRSMVWERACLFAGYVGAMHRQLEQTISYAKERKQFRKPISKNQAISHKIVDMKFRLEVARLLLYHACWLVDQDKDPVLEVALSKLAISEAAIQSSLDAIQIFGGNGFMAENGIERDLRNSIPATIFSGTSQIQRELIAMELGL